MLSSAEEHAKGAGEEAVGWQGVEGGVKRREDRVRAEDSRC